MATFRGSYQHSIDHKGRISIPARFRRLLSGDASDTFILSRGLETCVALYPLDEWQRMEERIRYDLDYIRHWSPWLDIRIIFLTAWIVLRDRNAY